MKSYTARRNQYGDLSSNTTSANLTRGDILMNDIDKSLVTLYKMSERTDTSQTTVAGQQRYLTPYNYDKLIDVTITIGSMKYTPREITDRATWDRINQTTYQSNIPDFYYIYNGGIEFSPTPSTSGYTITQNYKITHKDLSIPDYTTGTVAVTNNSTVVTGTTTVFTAGMVGRWIQISSATGGDNAWYEIATFTNSTTIGLLKPYAGTTVSGASFTIGEMSILDEKYQDIPMYYALMIYYSSKVKDQAAYKMYQTIYNGKMLELQRDMTSKSSSPVLNEGEVIELINPNLTVMY